MHVVLLAAQSSSTAYLDGLGFAGVPPRLVVVPAASPATPELEAEAQRWRVDHVRVESANDESLVDRVRALAPDLVLLAGWPDGIRAPLRSIARVATLKFHAARLPDYRAKEPLFWAILHDERTVGISVHHVTHEIDCGPVVWSRDVEVGRDATSASLSREVDRAGARFIPEILDAARTGAVPRGAHRSGDGQRFPPLRPEHGLIDITRPAVELERLVRAATGEILPYLFYRGVKLGVLRADVVRAPRGSAPGQVIAVEGGVAFATVDAALRIRRALFLNKSYDGEGLARELGIAIGARLSNSPAF